MQPTDRTLDPGVRLEGTLPGGARRSSRLGGFCPRGRHFPPCRNAALLQEPAPPALRAGGMSGSRLCLRGARTSGMMDVRAAPGRWRAPSSGYLPWFTTIFLCRRRWSFINSLIHSFPGHIDLLSPTPKPRAGPSLLAPGSFSLSSPNRVCNCSGALLPRRQRGAVPARLGRTPTSCPSTSGGLGPGSQPRDLFHSHSRKKESSCS